MKIVIDARMYGLEHAGIGRYILNLVNQIEKLDSQNTYFLFLRRKNNTDLKFKNKRIHKVLADYRHYSLIEQIRLPLQLIKLKPDLVHFPHFNAPVLWFGKQVVTIHDLIKHESRGIRTTTRSGAVYWLKFWLYKLLIGLTLKKAHRIIVPSGYWKKELEKRYRVDGKKIFVTREGVDAMYKSSRAAKSGKGAGLILKKYGVKKPFVIYTGSLYPHKNVARLVGALKLLRSENPGLSLSLVVVCARSVFFERFKKGIRESGAAGFVTLAGFVPDKELTALYRQAEGFVFPTLQEGFGLPGLEAMAAGCPVLASKIPVLEEIYGEAALYFDPLNEADIAKKIELLLNSRKLQSELRERGHSRVKKYSWRKMAQETLRVYDFS